MVDIDIYPKARNLDGVYYRVVRNGHACSVAFTDLTRADTLRGIADQFNIVMRED